MSYECTSRHIFGGVKDFCPNFPKLARNIFGSLFVRIFSHEEHIGRQFPKAKHVWRHLFSNQKTLDAIFARIFKELPRFSGILRRFSQIFARFPWIFMDFARIFTKSKLLGVCLHPCLLHHCTSASQVLNAPTY